MRVFTLLFASFVVAVRESMCFTRAESESCAALNFFFSLISLAHLVPATVGRSMSHTRRMIVAPTIAPELEQLTVTLFQTYKGATALSLSSAEAELIAVLGSAIGRLGGSNTMSEKVFIDAIRSKYSAGGPVAFKTLLAPALSSSLAFSMLQINARVSSSLTNQEELHREVSLRQS